MTYSRSAGSATYWFLFLFFANTLHFWFFFRLNTMTPTGTKVFIAFHLFAIFGAVWMLRDWLLRKKRRWKTFIWLSMVPYGFVWYYFDIFRKERQLQM
jgi:hypothetical protein